MKLICPVCKSDDHAAINETSCALGRIDELKQALREKDEEIARLRAFTGAQTAMDFAAAEERGRRQAAGTLLPLLTDAATYFKRFGDAFHEERTGHSPPRLSKLGNFENVCDMMTGKLKDAIRALAECPETPTTK